MKIGTSFSMCLRSIAKGEVALEEIAFIATTTAYPDREIMLKQLGQVMQGRDVETHLSNAAQLWDSGRIFQPSSRPFNRTATQLWIDVPGMFQKKNS